MRAYEARGTGQCKYDLGKLWGCPCGNQRYLSVHTEVTQHLLSLEAFRFSFGAFTNS